jgi:hypothetical protein
MSLSTKILLIIGAIATIGILGFIAFKQFEISNKQDAIEKQMVAQKDLIDGITRSQAQYASKGDIEKYIKENNVNLQAIKDDLDKLNASVSAVNVLIARSSGQTGTNIPSTGTGTTNPNPVDPTDADPYGYMKREQKLTLNENFAGVAVPFGTAGFSAWQKFPWSVNIPPREYKLINVIGTDENQRMYVYNKFSIKVNDKEYDVKINSAETKQEFPEAKFSWFNPRLFLTTGGAVNFTQAPIQGSANLGVTIGLMSYGRYKTNPAISILQLGVGYQTGTQRPTAIINPINFNIGGIIPGGLVNNTYIGPSVQIDTAGNVLAGANISLGF